MQVLRTAYVYIRNVFAGELCETDEGYKFEYDSEYLKSDTATSVSLTLPKSETPYKSKFLFPFKNFSLIETKVGSEQYIISPAYDLLPINIVMPEDKEEFALPMNGKKMNLRKKDFFVFAQECGISKASAEKMIKKITSMKDNFIDMVKQSFLPEALKEDFIKLIEKRTETFI